MIKLMSLVIFLILHNLCNIGAFKMVNFITGIIIGILIGVALGVAVLAICIGGTQKRMPPVETKKTKK